MVDLFEEADDILGEESVDVPDTDGEYDAGFISSFYIYPYGRALSFVYSSASDCNKGLLSQLFHFSMKGFYHVQMANECVQKGDLDGAKDHYLKGGNFYIAAADKLPDDDEEHACKSTTSDLPHEFWLKFISPGFLNCGVDNLFKCGSKPLRETLPILARIRLAVPKMKRIWGSSAMSREGRDQILKQAMMMEPKALEMIGNGGCTLDDCMVPQWH